MIYHAEFCPSLLQRCGILALATAMLPLFNLIECRLCVFGTYYIQSSDLPLGGIKFPPKFTIVLDWLSKDAFTSLRSCLKCDKLAGIIV